MINLTIKYGVFAIFAIAINISTQYASLIIYRGEYNLYIAMGFGTIAGLLIKYILDKKYIFYHRAENKKEDIQKFVLYSATGTATTAVFWGFEIVFDAIFRFGAAKFMGAIIGLSIGYFIKYHLDKKFVFLKV